MDKTTPNKESVRAWLKREVVQHQPPSDIKEIRRQLGWGLVEMARKSKRNP